MIKENITSLVEYPLPSTEDVECQVIADALINPDALYEIQQIVKSEMFSTDVPRALWQKLCDRYAAGEKIDMTTLAYAVDFEYFRAKILPISASIASQKQHALDLKYAAYRRSAYITAMRLLMLSGDANAEPNDINAPMAELMGDSGNADVSRTKHISDVVNKLATSIENREETRVRTGISTLDYITYGGFHGSWLIVLAARPGVGKTAVSMHMAQKAAESGSSVLYFSLEMADTELAQRMMLSTGEVTALQIADKTVDWNRFENAAKRIGHGNLYINDHDRNIRDIKTTAQAMKARGKCDIIFIDYLGLVRRTERRDKSRYEIVTDNTADLKQLACELGVPIVLLAQLNRSSVSEHREPQLYDLRDSGSIEQDADMVLMLDKVNLEMVRPNMDEEYYLNNNYIDMFVRKFRHGIGDYKIPMHADRTYSNFEVCEDITSFDEEEKNEAPKQYSGGWMAEHERNKTDFDDHNFDNEPF